MSGSFLLPVLVAILMSLASILASCGKRAVSPEEGPPVEEAPDQGTQEPEPRSQPTYDGWTIPPQELFRGAPKDGIPALTYPEFVSPSEATYLTDDDRVLGVHINGEAKAYPFKILWWHEIVNDEVGGRRVSITYCPLTGSGLAFDAVVEGTELTFGVSGLLYNNNLIMYDRVRGGLWSQMKMESINGDMAGVRLSLLSAFETTWGVWKGLHPPTQVLSIETGYRKRYGIYPYGSYSDLENDFIIFPMKNLDTSRPIKEMVLGVLEGGSEKVYPYLEMGAVRDRLAINDIVGGRAILVLYDAISGTAVAYDREVDGRLLSFRVDVDNPSDESLFSIRDEETGTLWSFKGEALDGPLAGSSLRQVRAHNAFWFAWMAFHPETEIWIR